MEEVLSGTLWSFMYRTVVICTSQAVIPVPIPFKIVKGFVSTFSFKLITSISKNPPQSLAINTQILQQLNYLYQIPNET